MYDWSYGSIDFTALAIAQRAAPYAPHPARLVGGDMPRYDADMDYWLSDDLTVELNPGYRCADHGAVSGCINA